MGAAQCDRHLLVAPTILQQAKRHYTSTTQGLHTLIPSAAGPGPASVGVYVGGGGRRRRRQRRRRTVSGSAKVAKGGHAKGPNKARDQAGQTLG